MDLKPDSPVQYIPRVGPEKARLLKKLGIETVNELIWHAPFRYNDFSQVSPINIVQPGETVTISGVVKSIVSLSTRTGKRMQVATVEDDSGKIEVIWFNQAYLLSVIRKETKLNLAGSVRWFSRKIAMISPDWEINRNEKPDSLHTGRLVPIYPETEGISSKWLRGRIDYLIKEGFADVEEILPEEIIRSYGLMNLSDAVKNIHFPGDQQTAGRSKYRLAFDELLILQLTAMEKKRIWQESQTSYPIISDETQLNKFLELLPFSLTEDQHKASHDIVQDIRKNFPMNRLLEGDVGSGKTVVAAIAMFTTALKGLNSVLMAPTQILAAQHYQTISGLFSPFKIPVKLITSETNIKNKAISNLSAQAGQQLTISNNPVIYIGTHALLSGTVDLNNVGIIIIDEQQRFGVAQRQLLKSKSTGRKTPHLLTMTATPIPRTIALAILGDLDLSIIRQMPRGRIRPKTWIVPNEKRSKAYQWIENQIVKNNSQAFIVCPLITESENLTDIKSVTSEYQKLRKIFPALKLGLLHGRLKSGQKNQVLNDFQKGKLNILVSTPVIEVGIDIPNAAIMMIEGADRFGLSQLHQLRGRIGRGNQQSYCLLFTETGDEKALLRLKSLENVFNGPDLAEIDLKLRGPGEIFGYKQHGLPDLKFADIFNEGLLNTAKKAAKEILDRYQNLNQFPYLSRQVQKGIIGSSEGD